MKIDQLISNKIIGEMWTANHYNFPMMQERLNETWNQDC